MVYELWALLGFLMLIMAAPGARAVEVRIMPDMPVAHINSLIGQAFPGDVFYFAGGTEEKPVTYHGMLLLAGVQGTEEQPVRFIADGSVVIDATGARHALKIRGGKTQDESLPSPTRHVQFLGPFIFTGAWGTGVSIAPAPEIEQALGVPVQGSGEHILFNGSAFVRNGSGYERPGPGKSGVGGSGFFSGGRDVTLLNVRASYNGEHGIYAGGERMIIAGSVAEDNHRCGIRAYGKDQLFTLNRLARNEGGVCVWTDSLATDPPQRLETDRLVVYRNRLENNRRNVSAGDGGGEMKNIYILDNHFISDGSATQYHIRLRHRPERQPQDYAFGPFVIDGNRLAGPLKSLPLEIVSSLGAQAGGFILHTEPDALTVSYGPDNRVEDNPEPRYFSGGEESAEPPLSAEAVKAEAVRRFIAERMKEYEVVKQNN